MYSFQQFPQYGGVSGVNYGSQQTLYGSTYSSSSGTSYYSPSPTYQSQSSAPNLMRASHQGPGPLQASTPSTQSRVFYERKPLVVQCKPLECEAL